MGLGAAFADAIASRRINVALLDRDADALAEQATALRARHPGVDFAEQVTELADRASVAAALDALEPREIGLLVACAAHAVIGDWLDVSLDEKLRHIEVNCVSVATMVDRLSRPMAERGRGGIVIVSSMAGTVGTELVSTYAATKAFDLILGESLWAELRARGVDVLSLVAGTTNTPGFRGSLEPGRKLPRGLDVMEPNVVVREALGALGARPSLVAGKRNRFAATLMQRILPRKTAIGIMSRATRALYRRAGS
jgi:short-subunit dehydrogenase